MHCAGTRVNNGHHLLELLQYQRLYGVHFKYTVTLLYVVQLGLDPLVPQISSPSGPLSTAQVQNYTCVFLSGRS